MRGEPFERRRTAPSSYGYARRGWTDVCDPKRWAGLGGCAIGIRTFYQFLQSGHLVALVLERAVAHLDELRAEAAARVRARRDHGFVDQPEGRAVRKCTERGRRRILHPVLESDAALESRSGWRRGDGHATWRGAKVVQPLNAGIRLRGVILLQATAKDIDDVGHAEVLGRSHVMLIWLNMLHPRCW